MIFTQSNHQPGPPKCSLVFQTQIHEFDYEIDNDIKNPTKEFLSKPPLPSGSLMEIKNFFKMLLINFAKWRIVIGKRDSRK